MTKSFYITNKYEHITIYKINVKQRLLFTTTTSKNNHFNNKTTFLTLNIWISNI